MHSNKENSSESEAKFAQALSSRKKSSRPALESKVMNIKSDVEPTGHLAATKPKRVNLQEIMEGGWNCQIASSARHITRDVNKAIKTGSVVGTPGYFAWGTPSAARLLLRKSSDDRLFKAVTENLQKQLLEQKEAIQKLQIRVRINDPASWIPSSELQSKISDLLHNFENDSPLSDKQSMEGEVDMPSSVIELKNKDTNVTADVSNKHLEHLLIVLVGVLLLMVIFLVGLLVFVTMRGH